MNTGRKWMDAFFANHRISIVDVGAKGGFREFSKLRRYAAITGFEPHPGEYQILQKASGNEEALFPHAISDYDGDGLLYLAHNSSLSSLLSFDSRGYRDYIGYHPNYVEWSKNFQAAERARVSVRKLDSLSLDLGIRRIDYLKIDTQGTELKVLRGAEGLLRQGKISLIKCEVAFVPVYEGQAYFSDIDTYLRQFGYRLVECVFYPGQADSDFRWSTRKRAREMTRFAQVGDAYYVIDHFPSPREQTVAGLLLAELGYVSLAASCLTELEVEKDLVIRYLSAQSPRDVLKRVVLNWLPPALLNLLRGRRSAG